MPRTRRLLLSIILVGLVGVVAGVGTYAAFFSSTANPGNSFAAGTVYITSNGLSGALVAMTSAKPNSPPTTGCIQVTYNGTLNSSVRLYGSTTGTLAQYLTLTVTRGTNSSPFNSCAGFTADATNYIGAGPGVIYSGNLNAFPTTYAAGIVDPTAGAPATWITSEAHAYRFVLTVQNNPAAQALSSTAAFTWEARNL